MMCDSSFYELDRAPSCPFSDDTVAMVIVTRENRNRDFYTLQTLRNHDEFKKKAITRPVVFITHGFISSASKSSFVDLSTAILEKIDSVVILIDWRVAACNGTTGLFHYFTAVSNTRLVGQYIATVTKKLVTDYKVSMADIRLIGHSLGAHVSGFAGKEVQKLKLGKYSEIIGLDPAGPCFESNDCSERLCKTDAHYVQIIHTSKLFGIKKSIGHVDFYVNQGNNQPGCGSDPSSYELDRGSKCPFSDDTVAMVIVTRENRNRDFYTLQTLRNHDEFKKKAITRPVVFITHGFTSSASVQSFVDLSTAILEKIDSVVISIDWRVAACNRTTGLLYYSTAVSNTRLVGRYIATVTKKLVTDYNVSMADIRLIGHSLGAHVSGFAGKEVQKLKLEKYSEIIGLDPAGPSFESNDCSERLCKTDAHYVQIIHTSKKFGIEKSIGHVDFYVNQGNNQPGCGNDPSLSNELDRVLPDCTFTSEAISFILFTRKISNGIVLTQQNLTNDRIFNKSDISSNLIIFLIHGFVSSANKTKYRDMIEALLEKDDFTIISIDWKEGACTNAPPIIKFVGYPKAVENTRIVGKYIADFSQTLMQKHKVSIENIRLIGHSLGAQIAGFAGKEFQKFKLGKYPEIIGLDPAGPLFESNNCSQRICETDAHYVQIIHTSEKLGTKIPLGFVDFYMNNGRNQPGCGSLVAGETCSHARSMIYFTECIKRQCCFIGIPKSKENRHGVSLTLKNLTSNNAFKESQLTCPVVFLIHGFVSSENDQHFLDMAQALLNKDHLCVISINWKEAACTNEPTLLQYTAYPKAVANTRLVGKYVADFTKILVEEYKVSMKDIRLIGHSLGAQVSGFAGKEVQKLKLGKYFEIIGLDPAGPLFRKNSCSQRICETDADYVQIIHTSNILGTAKALGTVDFYMNKGRSQPGCDLYNASCSHAKAVGYLTECIKRECCLIGIPWDKENRDGVLLTLQNLTDNKLFLKSKLSCPVRFLIHGFLSSANNTNYEDMTNALLNKSKVIVISIDWKKGACNGGASLLEYAGYFKAVENTRAVGQYVANFTKILVEEYKVSMKNIRVIGHSLGAQVAGFAGKEVQKLKLGKYSEIIGLDPAGPLFNMNNCSQRICETDADYVQIVHTSIPLGTERTLGTIDFYMNNGISQPGCNVVDLSCSHSKAVLYFTECIKRECCLIGMPWDDRSQSISTCTKEKCVCVGLNASNYPGKGKFYVPTKRDAPYCNNNGTVL
ncbi:phospholipase A1 2-like [Vespula squamosa]|uniref:phospholipase A1 n=1 Tax=Vespula squamosa TaxID=30214 RepID=A0ABD2A4K8_VESSQ